MDVALGVGIYVLGAISGALILYAMLADYQPVSDVHSVRDDLEARTRRAQ